MESLSSSKEIQNQSSFHLPAPHLTLKNVPLLQFLLRGSERESSYQLSPDNRPLPLPLILVHLVEDVPVYQLLFPRPLLQLHRERLLPSELGCQTIWNVLLPSSVIVCRLDDIYCSYSREYGTTAGLLILIWNIKIVHLLPPYCRRPGKGSDRRRHRRREECSLCLLWSSRTGGGRLVGLRLNWNKQDWIKWNHCKPHRERERERLCALSPVLTAPRQKYLPKSYPRH